MIDTAQKAIEAFGKLGSVETRVERAQVPARQLVRLNGGRRRVC